MRVLAVIIALLFVGASIQQLPISNECMFKGFELLPLLQKLDMEALKTNTDYASTLISKVIIAANICFKTMPTQKLGVTINAQCKENLVAIVDTLKGIVSNFLKREFTSLATTVSTLKAKVSAARSACSK